MAESREHRETAERIARKFGVDYNSGQGPDINAPTAVIEVETPTTVEGGLQQLNGYRKRAYIAGTNQTAVNKAKEVTRNTTVGVMDKWGDIVASSSR